MKKKNLYKSALLAVTVVAFVFTASGLFGYSQGNGRGQNQAGSGRINNSYLFGVVETFPIQDLSSEEKESIRYMREEEKLARDVYSALADKWDMPIFANIAQSEQTHMEALKFLIDRYDLEDPAGKDVPGEFQNREISVLYNDLVEKGSRSLSAAFEIGVTIEDLDLADLYKDIDNSDNDDLRVVYQNLAKGSRNHLRSFYRQLASEGGSYQAKYLEQNEFDRIRTSRPERGVVIEEPEFQF
ncbi:MAG: DUF2202 domain-containing protein [Spirochaetales bacterium]|nr:DUF2202 domain-containing protein [Spirochaetales bacterium]MCF7938684.1 DUF2202 domain-containing protein [Spirochaetales bacterium]